MCRRKRSSQNRINAIFFSKFILPKNYRAWIPLREVKLHLSYFTILSKNLTYFTNHYQIIFV